MIKVFAKNDCGCCTTEMHFTDLASAQKAFDAAGLGNGMKITDDMGTTHEGLDTFYGFSQDEEEAEGRSLGFLVGEIEKKLG